MGTVGADSEEENKKTKKQNFNDPIQESTKAALKRFVGFQAHPRNKHEGSKRMLKSANGQIRILVSFQNQIGSSIQMQGFWSLQFYFVLFCCGLIFSKHETEENPQPLNFF